MPGTNYPYKFDESDEEEEKHQLNQTQDDSQVVQDGIISRIWNGTSTIYSKYQKRKEKFNNEGTSKLKEAYQNYRESRRQKRIGLIQEKEVREYLY